MDEILDNKKNKSGWGGKREGSGRPKGSLNKTTKEKKAIEQAFHAKVMESADALFNAQLRISTGQQFLYKIEKIVTWGKTDKDGNRQAKKIEAKPPKLVTDPYEIEQYLQEKVIDGDIGDPEDTYYFITTKAPENSAINSMLDRVYGKAKVSMDVDHSTKGQPITSIKIIEDNGAGN